MNRTTTIRIKVDTSAFNRAMRHLTRALADLCWNLSQTTITDDETLAFRWAIRHVREGRPDLAREDLAWLLGRSMGRRIRWWWSL